MPSVSFEIVGIDGEPHFLSEPQKQLEVWWNQLFILNIRK